MIIYKITNNVNGKEYIGQDSKNNPKYFGSGKIIRLAIKKYGKQNFKKEILEKCNSIKELNDAEDFWIEKLNSVVPNGYNIIKGGNCARSGEKNGFYGKHHTEKNKNKWRVQQSRTNEEKYGNKVAAEISNKISMATKGKCVSLETREKMSLSQKRKTIGRKNRKR